MRIAFFIALMATNAFATTFVITSSADSGPGTLRQAILDANANPGRDAITFATATVNTINSQTPITDRVDIDGQLAGGGRVEIATQSAGTGFSFAPGSDASTLQNVATRNFSESIEVRNGVTDVRITNSEGRSTSFGTETVLISGTRTVFGTVGAGNRFRNIVLFGGSRNVAAGNDARFIMLSSGLNLVAADNHVTEGIEISVCGVCVVERNEITDVVAGYGIRLRSVLIAPVIIRDNTVRFAAIGIGLEGTSAIVERNHLIDNTRGVVISGKAAQLSANTISGGTLAIDLGADGPTPNDPAPDADTGANNRQNFPVLTSAHRSPAGLAVAGTLTSAPSTPYAIEFFWSAASDPKANVFIGSTSVTTDATGNASFQALFTANGPPSGAVITATATNRGPVASAGNAPNETSELSAPLAATDTAADAIPTLSLPALLLLALALAVLGVVRK